MHRVKSSVTRKKEDMGDRRQGAEKGMGPTSEKGER